MVTSRAKNDYLQQVRDQPSLVKVAISIIARHQRMRVSVCFTARLAALAWLWLLLHCSPPLLLRSAQATRFRRRYLQGAMDVG